MGSFVTKFVAKTFQKLPNLVTLLGPFKSILRFKITIIIRVSLNSFSFQWLCIEHSLTFKGSISVQLVSRLTGLNCTKQETMLTLHCLDEVKLPNPNQSKWRPGACSIKLFSLLIYDKMAINYEILAIYEQIYGENLAVTSNP